MKPIKNFLLAILWLVLITAGIYIAYQRQAFASIPPLERVLALMFDKSSTDSSTLGIAPLNNLDKAKIEKAWTDASSQLKVLSSRGQATGEMSSQVLGEFIQVNEEDSEKNTSGKVLEYGRYLYCQQVVKDYEQK